LSRHQIIIVKEKLNAHAVFRQRNREIRLNSPGVSDFINSYCSSSRYFMLLTIYFPFS